jgi:hypothetical protein
MISGAHVVVYSKDADADRAFLRDVLAYGEIGLKNIVEYVSPWLLPSGLHNVSVVANFRCD